MIDKKNYFTINTLQSYSVLYLESRAVRSRVEAAAEYAILLQTFVIVKKVSLELREGVVDYTTCTYQALELEGFKGC